VPAADVVGDPEAYLAAAAGEPEACHRIVDPVLAGECGAFAAQSMASSNLSGALRICDGLTDPFWRDECSFLACDTVAVEGDEARRCCARAGRYETRCIGHAVSRSVYAELARFERGDEVRSWEAAQRASVQALGPAGAERAADLFVRFLVDRSDGAWLHADDCGGAPERLCADAYAEMVARVAGGQSADPEAFVRAACARTVSVERATGLGLPGWDPEVDAAVQQAFVKMCAR